MQVLNLATKEKQDEILEQLNVKKYTPFRVSESSADKTYNNLKTLALIEGAGYLSDIKIGVPVTDAFPGRIQLFVDDEKIVDINLTGIVTQKYAYFQYKTYGSDTPVSGSSILLNGLPFETSFNLSADRTWLLENQYLPLYFDSKVEVKTRGFVTTSISVSCLLQGGLI